VEADAARAARAGDRGVRTGSTAGERSDGRVPGSDSATLLDIPTERMVTVKEDKGSSEQEQEWLRQLSLIYGGLILIGVYLVQPFLTAASLDLSAKVCVVAFSVAIPLLARPCGPQSAGGLPSSYDQVIPCRDYEGGRAKLRLRWRGRRLLAHPVDRRGGDLGERAGGGGSSLGRLHAPGTGSGASAQEGEQPDDTEA
jgi:hypothetical protein